MTSGSVKTTSTGTLYTAPPSTFSSRPTPVADPHAIPGAGEKPCKFAGSCTRKGCVFLHPWDKRGGASAAGQGVSCHWGAACTRGEFSVLDLELSGAQARTKADSRLSLFLSLPPLRYSSTLSTSTSPKQPTATSPIPPTVLPLTPNLTPPDQRTSPKPSTNLPLPRPSAHGPKRPPRTLAIG